jgi:predicted ATPase
VAELVSAVVGLRGHAPSGELAGWLALTLAARQMLLIFDNCERVIGPAAALAGRLLRAASGVRFLVTSQEPLAIAGEQMYEVPPLGLPGRDDGEAGQVSRAAAVQLFVSRAAAAGPGFRLEAGNALAVAGICRRLDGIPLALELAAARVRALGVHALAARLDDRFRLLTAGRREAPARQQTLRATIDWSWELASEPERVVLRRLATHADGCTLAAAEQTCAAGGLDREDIAGLLARLVDRSLVAVSDGDAEEPRYRLLESVAAYGLERLREAGELDRFQRRHGQYYAALAEQARAELRGPEQRHWLQRLDRESANMHRALANAAAQQDPDLALRLAGALTWYWFLRGRLTEARRALQSALAAGGSGAGAAGARAARAFATAWLAGLTLLAGSDSGPAGHVRQALAPYHEAGDAIGRAEAEWFLGFAASDFGDLAPSEELVSRALAAFRALHHQWGIAAALSTSAKHASARGDLAAVREHGQQSLLMFREIGDGWGQLQATEWLAARCETIGDYEQARQLHVEGLQLAQELGLWPQAADRLTWLGRIAMLTGDYAQARELLDQGRRLAAEQAYKPGEVFAEISLGSLARREGDPGRAAAHLGAVLGWHRQMGYAPDTGKGMVLAELGFAAEQRGDPAAASAFHAEALAVARQLGDARGMALALEGLAGARTAAGRPHDAALLLGAAAGIRQARQAPLSPAEQDDADRITQATRAALGPGTFAAQLRRGARLPPRGAAGDWAGLLGIAGP